MLEVWAWDHSWLPRLRQEATATAAVEIDLTPPRVEILTGGVTLQIGGTAVVVYRIGPDAVASGVQIDRYFFPGSSGPFKDEALRAALFTVPPALPDARPRVVARDGAGNERSLPLDVRVRSRVFRDRTLDLSDRFLARKVPGLLEENGLAQTTDLVDGYLRINRDLRAATEERLQALCRESAARDLPDGALLRLPNAASLSFFGDRRSYRYDGEIVDRQRHLGFDLASVHTAPVPAATAGRIVHAGPLGIYGETVVIDHGLGLFSLYGHLSSIQVTVDASVERGTEIGRTGDTGLAGGDHLHFSTMLYGVHVDPREWWDARWIRDHLTARLGPHRGDAG
jgi:murein DD-endopeptidase MepM/ murein hydrolase activator NlpD